MASTIPQPMDERETAEKGRWVRPAVNSLDVGEAEGSDGPGPDGGLAS